MNKKIGAAPLVVVLAILSLGCKSKQEIAGQSETSIVSPEQQKRLDLMKSEGPNASLTILPVRLAGKPVDRVTEAVGWLLEQRGLQCIELGKTAFEPGGYSDLAHAADSLGEFVKQNLITTGYVLYAEINGAGRVDELRAVLVDKSGALVWSDRQTPQGATWKKMGGDGDLLVCCTVLAERLAPQFGLNEQTAKAAKPGKMAAIMAERSGQPPEQETAPLPERQKAMRESGQGATLMVFPARVGGNAVDAASAGDLAKMINEAGLCKAVAATQPVLLKASLADPNELKGLWDMAREFRDYVRKNSAEADYVLYADYIFTPQNWEQGMVHFVVCDRKGEWVIVDMQNSHHPDYQSIKPTSKGGCNKLLLKRLKNYLR